jgi:hypothetical protein
LQGLYGFAAQVYQAKAMSEFHFGSIENHLKTNLRLNHLEQDVAQIKQVFSQQALQLRTCVMQLKHNIQALSDSLAQQNKTLTQLNAGQQEIANKILQIGQSLRTARRVELLTKAASSVASLAPMVGSFVGGLFEAGFKLHGLTKAHSLVAGFMAFKEQVGQIDMPENVQALTVGMIIPELSEHAACTELARTPLKDLIEAAGSSAQQYYYDQIEKTALSVDAPAISATSAAQLSSVQAPSASIPAAANSASTPTAHSSVVLRAVDRLQPAASQLKKIGVPGLVKFSAAVFLIHSTQTLFAHRSKGSKPARDFAPPPQPLHRELKTVPLAADMAVPDQVEVLATGDLLPPSETNVVKVPVANGHATHTQATDTHAADTYATQAASVKPGLLRQDSGLDDEEGNDNRLAASIKGNNLRIFKRELLKAIEADTLNNEVRRVVNVDMRSTVLDIAAHYGRLDMAEAIEEAGGQSLRHGDPIRALRIAERHVGQYDDMGERIEA